MSNENAANLSESKISLETRGHILLIGLNRPEKRNAFDVQMLTDLALAYTKLEDDDNLRCAVVFAHGEMFTAGLDLANVAPVVMKNGKLTYPENSIDPWGGDNRRVRTKPLIYAINGKCLTLGIEMALAADIRIAAENAVFGQIEIKRGIFPFGGATVRFPAVAGWGNAMRWLLTGDEFDAQEALRIGVVQEVVPLGKHVDRAIEIAETIAAQAPLGVRATIASARKAENEGHAAALQDLSPQIIKLLNSEDAKEGVQSFIERRAGNFQGK